MKTPEQLKSAGFTETGITEYTETVNDYADELFDHAITYSSYNRKQAAGVEVTGEHVVRGARRLARIFARPRSTVLSITSHVAEYIFFALTGAGFARLFTWWGIPLAGLSLSFAVILMELRHMRNSN